MMDLDFRPLDLQALEGEKMPDQMDGNSDLAKAMLVQSQALTALVGQIAQSSQDPIADLSSGSSAASTRGSVGRARLQAELASHSGSFYLWSSEGSWPCLVSSNDSFKQTTRDAIALLAVMLDQAMAASIWWPY